MRTTIDLPDAILTRAKKEAASRNTTLRALIIEALQSNLGRRTTRFTLKDASFGSDSVNPAERVGSGAINAAIDADREFSFRT
jgi:hypothetical protein